MREASNQEISTLADTDQLARNRHYVGSIVGMITFLAIHQLLPRGDHDSFESMTEPGSGMFLSLFECTLQKEALPLPHCISGLVDRSLVFTWLSFKKVWMVCYDMLCCVMLCCVVNLMEEWINKNRRRKHIKGRYVTGFHLFSLSVTSQASDCGTMISDVTTISLSQGER